jgi:uncharacterized protein (TIRG00374 family)
MAKIYKRLILLLLLVGGISGAVIYFTVDINTLRHLTSFRPWSLLAALFFLAVGLYFDGTRLMHLVRISGENIRLVEAVQVVFGNYFLALLTPGAAGGAVAQVMFLRRAGVPTGKATVLVVVRTILSILFLLCAMPLVFYYDPDLLPWLPKGTLALGSTIIVAGIFGGILLFRTTLPHYLLIKITKKLSHARRRTAFAIYRDVQGAVILLSTAPLRMMRVLVESAISLLFLYSVVPVLFMGMGAEADWLRILGRMIFLNIFLYFAPTPGGSGIAETGFIWLFKDFVPSGTVGIAAVTWRMFAEYLPFSIGLYYTIRVFGRGFLTKQLNK